MSLEIRLWLASAVFLASFLALGYAVLTHPQNAVDERANRRLRGRATPVALFFTWTGRSLPLVALGVVATAVFFALHGRIWIPIAVSISQVVSQGAVELFKARFNRRRPDVFFGGRELGLSYPSGHATTAIVFYGAWLLLIAGSTWAPAAKVAGEAVLAVWLVGVDWSRLALGAHYVTDVAGGTLFGCAWILALWSAGIHAGLLPS